MEAFLLKAGQLVAALSLLVIIHEFGHYMFARIFGIRVDKFFLFFNPWFYLVKYNPKTKKWSFFKDKPEDKAAAETSKTSDKATWRDTEYGVGWLPLGGYVQIAGMIDETQDASTLGIPHQTGMATLVGYGRRCVIQLPPCYCDLCRNSIHLG